MATLVNNSIDFTLKVVFEHPNRLTRINANRIIIIPNYIHKITNNNISAITGNKISNKITKYLQNLQNLENASKKESIIKSIKNYVSENQQTIDGKIISTGNVKAIIQLNDGVKYSLQKFDVNLKDKTINVFYTKK
jgi:hypothetical protein